ncbi:uncharacterized protein BJ212DRAFT_496733 [Suillus subaureus]|uniref:Uncharacterized protein n=1 Tax=Suillus subaureus TaxID=48587 RepID=A0A9P7JAK6_9AGAM|nr:uncharacterized protein BJ212DRAFT_496733 [Suillus subaureus]KAG1811845.1 hypothetical protein BJ212DRAFT_496733 [Suillus subaureus]
MLEFIGGVYSAVSQIMDLNWHTLPARPRLSYFKDDHILLIETCSDIHEAPFGYLGQELFGFLLGFTHNQRALSTTLSMNFELGSIIPDMSIRTVAVTRGHLGHRKVHVIGECAFAQDTDSVLCKIKEEIAERPEILMAIMVVIDEHHPYHSPERMSEAWQMLRHETSARSPSSFHSLQGDPARSHDKHIVIAGHTWCHLASVQFHVWVRGDEPINVDDTNNELLARGTLFPNQDMDEVEAMIKKGMEMTQDCLANFSQKVAPGGDISALRNSNASLTFYWHHLLASLAVAVEDTAYARYCSWYNSYT